MVHYEMTPDLTIKVKAGGKKRKERERQNNLLLAKYANVGYYLVTPLLAGVFLGLTIDSFFQTKPSFTIGLLLFGIVSVFYNLYSLTRDKF